MTKRCSGCGATKPLDEFHRHKAKADGRQNWCKPCLNAAVGRSKSTYRVARPPKPAVTDAPAGVVFTPDDIRHMVAVIMREVSP